MLRARGGSWGFWRGLGSRVNCSKKWGDAEWDVVVAVGDELERVEEEGADKARLGLVYNRHVSFTTKVREPKMKLCPGANLPGVIGNLIWV